MRPSREVSILSFLMGVIFTGIGLFVVIPMISSNGGPGWFGIVWTLGALGMTIFHGVNAFTDRGIAVEEIQFDSKDSSKSASERLAEIEEMKNRGIISQAEYNQKRAEIIAKI